jgi:2,4-dienoyl-CoA reductase-like NADH-dependent reductase (Old Yellow Enzyme family)
MDDLFSPFTIKAIELKNRIVMPALASFLTGNDGSISDATVEHYRRRAGGGPAMVITEACAVSPEGVVSAHQARIYEDRFIEGLSRIAATIKEEGSLPGDKHRLMSSNVNRWHRHHSPALPFAVMSRR